MYKRQELARETAAISPELPVVFISGYSETAVVRYGVVAHGMHFIRKPFSPSELLCKLRDVIPPRNDGGAVETRTRM